MTDPAQTDHGTPETDRELLEATWTTYADAFAEHVGEIVTPADHAQSEEHVEWGAQVFMFGYALGSIAGASAADPAFEREIDLSRVEDVVQIVIEIGASEDFQASSETVTSDLVE